MDNGNQFSLPGLVDIKEEIDDTTMYESSNLTNLKPAKNNDGSNYLESLNDSFDMEEGKPFNISEEIAAFINEEDMHSESKSDFDNSQSIFPQPSQSSEASQSPQRSHYFSSKPINLFESARNLVASYRNDGLEQYSGNCENLFMNNLQSNLGSSSGGMDSESIPYYGPHVNSLNQFGSSFSDEIPLQKGNLFLTASNKSKEDGSLFSKKVNKNTLFQLESQSKLGASEGFENVATSNHERQRTSQFSNSIGISRVNETDKEKIRQQTTMRANNEIQTPLAKPTIKKPVFKPVFKKPKKSLEKSFNKETDFNVCNAKEQSLSSQYKLPFDTKDLNTGTNWNISDKITSESKLVGNKENVDKKQLNVSKLSTPKKVSESNDIQMPNKATKQFEPETVKTFLATAAPTSNKGKVNKFGCTVKISSTKCKTSYINKTNIMSYVRCIQNFKEKFPNLYTQKETTNVSSLLLKKRNLNKGENKDSEKKKMLRNKTDQVPEFHQPENLQDQSKKGNVTTLKVPEVFKSDASLIERSKHSDSDQLRTQTSFIEEIMTNSSQLENCMNSNCEIQKLVNDLPYSENNTKNSDSSLDPLSETILLSQELNKEVATNLRDHCSSEDSESLNKEEECNTQNLNSSVEPLFTESLNKEKEWNKHYLNSSVEPLLINSLNKEEECNTQNFNSSIEPLLTESLNKGEECNTQNLNSSVEPLLIETIPLTQEEFNSGDKSSSYVSETLNKRNESVSHPQKTKLPSRSQQMQHKFSLKTRKETTKLKKFCKRSAPKRLRKNTSQLATIKEHLYQLQRQTNFPVWVECENCSKWRCLKEVTDPGTLPNHWTCSLIPDNELSFCSIPQEDFDQEEHDTVFAFNKFTLGSVVWVTSFGPEWWPAMVDDDPDTDTFFWLPETSNVPNFYHVTFFGSDVSRAWVKSNSVVQFVAGSERVRRASKTTTRRALKDAIGEAKSALTLPLSDRRHIYCFATRFRGKWFVNSSQEGKETSH